MANGLHCSTRTDKGTITMPPFFFCRGGPVDSQLGPQHATCLFPLSAPVRKVLRSESSPLWVCVNGGAAALVWVVSWPWVSGFGGVSYHLDPHLGLKSSGAVDRGFWGQKIFNLGFEEIEGEEAQVQGLPV